MAPAMKSLICALSLSAVIAEESCPSSDPTCAGVEEAALLQRDIARHVHNKTQLSCSAVASASCGSATKCYWDEECKKNGGGLCCAAGGAEVACRFCGTDACPFQCPEPETPTPAPSCNRGLEDRCTNPKGPPCPKHSSCQHATGYCVCKEGFCGFSGQCEPECPAEELEKHPQSCTNPKGPPCPPGSRCHPATGYCYCGF